MAGKRKIRIFYRAPPHVPLWQVMDAGGFLAKHGLEMSFGSMEDKRARATAGLLSGELDIVSGNHHSLYARRALHAEPFVHIAQVNNQWNQNWLATAPGIRSVADLKGKRLSIDKLDQHPGLNAWLFLRQSGLLAGRDVEMVAGDRKAEERVRQVMAGEYDGTFLGVVDQARARAMGAQVIQLPTMPMIEGVTLTTTTRYVNSHPEEVSGLLHALVDAIHYFKTDRQGTLEIINKTCRDLLKFRSDEELELFYRHHSETYEPKPYPTPEAIRNVFALGVKETPEIAGFNPLVMWDLHHLRAIDDSGYIDRLYNHSN
ncbi:MAG: NMT1-like family [Alphaproteobacteria bacterium]|jgi:ABC-type nitrate/sulfonate/bicarbonate transport system substrate-binding protein|nr:NMT1-like family [Alphaproteobacteria bacterium]